MPRVVLAEQVRKYLIENPKLTVKESFARLEKDFPGVFKEGGHQWTFYNVRKILLNRPKEVNPFQLVRGKPLLAACGGDVKKALRAIDVVKVLQVK